MILHFRLYAHSSHISFLLFGFTLVRWIVPDELVFALIVILLVRVGFTTTCSGI
jgi:hypothetical protein